MSIYRYADKCRQIGDEIAQEFSSDQYERVHELFSQIAFRDWIGWLHQHADEIAALLRLTPRVRAARLAKQPEDQELLMRIALSQSAHETAEFLRRFSDIQIRDRSYRGTLSAMFALMKDDIWCEDSIWPISGEPPYPDMREAMRKALEDD